MTASDASLSVEDAHEAEAVCDAIRRGGVDAFVLADGEIRLLDSARAPCLAVVNRMCQGAVVVDATGAIVFANEVFLSLVQAPQRELFGRPLASHVASTDHAMLASLLASTGDAKGELQLRTAGGARPVVQVTVATLEEMRLVLFLDVTLQKRHEATDARTRKFLGMLAHEMRNLLGPVTLTTARLRKMRRDDADLQSALETIERQANRMAALIDDLQRVNPRE